MSCLKNGRANRPTTSFRPRAIERFRGLCGRQRHFVEPARGPDMFEDVVPPEIFPADERLQLGLIDGGGEGEDRARGLLGIGFFFFRFGVCRSHGERQLSGRTQFSVLGRLFRVGLRRGVLGTMISHVSVAAVPIRQRASVACRGGVWPWRTSDRRTRNIKLINNNNKKIKIY